jgi:uncharacterized protein (DUF433 family)
VGILGGAPFTDVVNATTTNTTSFLPTSANFTVSPALQINLPLSLRLEVDALYRPYSFSVSNGNRADFSVADFSAAQWRFPFLAQYRFDAPVVRDGKPCVRGMRITVNDVLGWLAHGMTEEQILEEHPGLEKEDFPAVYAFAAEVADTATVVNRPCVSSSIRTYLLN